MLGSILDFCYVRGGIVQDQQFIDEKDLEEFLWIDTETTLSQVSYQNSSHGNEYDLISKEIYEYVLEKLLKDIMQKDTENKLMYIRYGE